MLAWLKRFFTDADYFSNVMLGLRGALLGLGVAVTGGQIDLGPFAWWAGPALVLVGGMLRQGTQNKPLLDEIMQMTPEQKAQVKALLG